MKRSKKISILMMNYNHAHTIERAIEAVKNQVLLPYELIIADDKSQDNSIEKIQTSIKDISWIKLIANRKNLGNIGNANFLLNQVKTDYAIWASADDFLLFDIIQRYENYLKKYNEIGIITSTALTYSADGFSGFYSPKFISSTPKFIKGEYFPKNFAMFSNFFKGSTSLYNINLLRKYSGFDLKLESFADTVIASLLASQKGCIYDPFPGSVCQRFANGFASRTMRSEKSLISILSGLTLYKNKLSPLVFDELTKNIFSRYITINYKNTFSSIWDEGKDELPFAEVTRGINIHITLKKKQFKQLFLKFIGKYLEKYNKFIFIKNQKRYLKNLKKEIIFFIK